MRTISCMLTLLVAVAAAPAQTPTIRCPLGAAPQIDGQVDEDEWNDAIVVRAMTDPWAYDAIADEIAPVYPPDDLDCEVRMKHDGERLYVLVRVVDDVLYNIDVDAWAPTDADRDPPYWDSPAGQEDWGWWGDCVELAICANPAGDFQEFPYTGPCDPARPGQCWKIQGNASYLRTTVGDVLQPWRDDGSLEWKIVATPGEGYVQEWSLALDPWLATGDGEHYQPGESPPMGVQLIVLDLDTPQAGQGHWCNIHHQAVWSYSGVGGKKKRVNWGRLILDDQPLPDTPAGGEQAETLRPEEEPEPIGVVLPALLAGAIVAVLAFVGWFILRARGKIGSR